MTQFCVNPCGDMVVILSRTGDIEFSNDQFYRVIPKFHKLFKDNLASDSQSIYPAILTGLSENIMWSGELVFRSMDNDVPVHSQFIPIVTQHQYTTIFSLHRHIGYQKELEHQLVDHHLYQGLQYLASSIEHDLNNLMTPYMMAASLLDSVPEGVGTDTSRLRTISESIKRSTLKGSGYLKNLVKLIRGHYYWNRFNVSMCIQDIVFFLRSTLPSKITIEYQSMISSDYFIIGHESIIHTLFMDLIVNSRGQIPDSGLIQIHVEKSLSAKGFVLITISDFATGALSSPYKSNSFQIRPDNRALHLSVSLMNVKLTLERIGGNFKVKSDPTNGSTYYLYLPTHFKKI